MQQIVYFLLMISVGCCTEVKIVSVGENVTLTCPLQTSTLYQDSLYWIRLISGNWPEFLGATFNFEFDGVSKIPRIQTKQEPGEFLLHINEAQRNDTGLYYCIKVRSLDFIFMNGTFLQIKGQESDVPVVVQKPPSDPAHPENPETLQCSVLSGSDRKTCPVDNRVYWFKAGSDHSHPSLLYLQGSNGDECEKSPEVPSTQKCFYNFSETSDDGTYYCAVAACGQILFGNGAKLEGAKVQDFYKLFLALLCSAVVISLIISLIILAILVYAIKKSNDNASTALLANSSVCKNWPVDVYTAVVFTVMNADGGGKKKTNSQTKQICTAVTVFCRNTGHTLNESGYA